MERDHSLARLSAAHTSLGWLTALEPMGFWADATAQNSNATKLGLDLYHLHCTVLMYVHCSLNVPYHFLASVPEHIHTWQRMH